MQPNFSYTVATPDTKTKGLAWSGDPEFICGKLREIGYQGVEFFIRDPAELDPVWYKHLLARNNLAAAAVGTGLVSGEDGLSLTNPEPKGRRAAIERAKAVIDFAAVLDCQVNIGKFRGEWKHSPNAREWMEEAFLEIAEHAQKKGIFITLEPQNRFTIDNMTTVHESVTWLKKMNLPSLRVMLDVFHMQIDEACIPACFIEAADLLLHVHFADTNRGCPGTGSIDFAMILHILKAMGYNRYISMEIKQTPDSEGAARQALEYAHMLVRSIWR